jgi:transposase
MDGHDADAAEMLWEIIPDDVFEKIKAVCLDMSGTFASVARAMAPHIKVVHDRFHVSKHLNEAVDPHFKRHTAKAGDQAPCHHKFCKKQQGPPECHRSIRYPQTRFRLPGRQ